MSDASARPVCVNDANSEVGPLIPKTVKAFYEEGRDQNAPIVIYCSGGDCEDSHMLAEKLYMVGFNNLLVYKDGFPGWQKRGLPAVKGPKP